MSIGNKDVEELKLGVEMGTGSTMFEDSWIISYKVKDTPTMLSFIQMKQISIQRVGCKHLQKFRL
jgi:hypothetical protein